MSSRAQAIALSPTREFKGNDGLWSTFKVTVGNPGQDFELLPWISGSQLWIPNPTEACKNFNNTNCNQTRGGSNSYEALTESQSWQNEGSYVLHANPRLFNDSTARWGLDGVTLQALDSSEAVGSGSRVIAAYNEPAYWLGLLGLSNFNTTFQNNSQPVVSTVVALQQDKIISSQAFGYAAGAVYASPQDFGSLVIGGFDFLRRDSSSEITLPIETEAETQSLPVTLWGLGVEHGMTGGWKSLMDDANPVEPVPMLLDSSAAQLWLPEPVCQQLVEAFNLTYVEESGLYTISPANRDTLLHQNATLSFRLGPSNDNSITIELPYAALNLTMAPANSDQFLYFPLRKAVNGTSILGRAFLQEAYLTVDWDNHNFTISRVRHQSADPVVSLLARTSADSNSHEAESKSLNSSQLGGVVAGCILLALALLVFGWWLLRRRRMERQHAAADSTPESGDQKDAEVEAKKPELLSLSSDTQQTWNRLRAGSEELDSNSILPPYTSAELMSRVLHEMDGREETHELSADTTVATPT